LCQGAIRLDGLGSILCHCQNQQAFLQLAAKFDIRPHSRVELSHDVTVLVRRRRLRVTHGSRQDHQGDRK
jgi:hypothetical protein